MHDVTQLLEQVGRGQRQVSDELLPLVYEELRRLAASSLARALLRACIPKPGED
ncbi:MAG: hypothetical protein FJ405_04455 [Verrucomicrobia bacterium]|nr:hypothetical protein [Verrucomicrobiota bacterium]